MSAILIPLQFPYFVGISARSRISWLAVFTVAHGREGRRGFSNFFAYIDVHLSMPVLRAENCFSADNIEAATAAAAAAAAAIIITRNGRSTEMVHDDRRKFSRRYDRRLANGICCYVAALAIKIITARRALPASPPFDNDRRTIDHNRVSAGVAPAESSQSSSSSLRARICTFPCRTPPARNWRNFLSCFKIWTTRSSGMKTR